MDIVFFHDNLVEYVSDGIHFCDDVSSEIR